MWGEALLTLGDYGSVHLEFCAKGKNKLISYNRENEMYSV